ncbi:MAG: hypothetical protein RL846_22210 [Deltaproteobacteria bacterium]
MGLVRNFTLREGRQQIELRPGRRGADAGAPRAQRPTVTPTVLPHRPDPAAMYLPSPFAAATHRPEHPALASIAECLRARPARLERKWAMLAARLGADDLDYARRLCRQLVPNDWRRLLAIFSDALLRARFDRQARWRARDQRLPEGWWRAPWYYVDPREGFEAALDEAKALGFENVGLLVNVGADLAAGGTARLERFMARAQRLGLRIAVGVDFGSDPATWWTGGDLRDPDVLGRVFATLGREANLGVLATRTHRVDRWLPEPRDAHLVHALIKLFLKMLGAHEIVIPELAPDASPLPFGGGGVVVNGDATTSEGDLLFDHDLMDALRAAVRTGDRSALDVILSEPPRPLHGAALAVALEHHDEPERPSVASLVEHDPQRLEAAYQLLYSVPATPIVYAASLARAPDAVCEAVRTLNVQRRRPQGVGASSTTAPVQDSNA